jgi:hypothetical protein
VKEINAAGGKAIGVSADASSPNSLSDAFKSIEKELPEHQLAAAVFNAAGGFARKPFVELKPEELETSLSGSV